jgi:hypothetical protein
MDYNKFREKQGIDNNAMIDLLSKYYPSYSKIVQSYINHPEKYGVRLTVEAERIVREAFAPKTTTERKVKRNKNNVLLVRLDDAAYDMVKDKMRESGLTPVFLEEGVSFQEAEVTLVCRKLYRQTIYLAAMPEDVRKGYYEKDAVHDMYIAEVVRILR